jgi:hypothetical protein
MSIGLLCSVALAVGISACGGSGSKSSTTKSAAAAATNTSTTTSQTSTTTSQTTPDTTTTTTTTTSPAKHANQQTKHAKSGGSTQTTSSGGVSPSGATNKQTSTGSTKHSSTNATNHSSSSHGGGSSGNGNGSASTGSHKKTNSKPHSAGTGAKPVAALPQPVVAASAGGVRASLHGESHAPVAGKLWHYSVLATDASGKALSGKVDTEFVFGGQVVGREKPPTHQLKNGRLDDKVTFPAQAIGIPLTFRVVVHASAGTLTLNWPVKVRH